MRTLMYMGMTTNGYIARENDQTPWPRAEFAEYYRTAKHYDVTIIGRRTYQIMKRAGELRRIGDPTVIVLTKKPQKGGKKLIFVKSPREALRAAQSTGARSVIISGGGTINSAFMKENLVDELYVDVVPIAFGKGIKLFKEADFERRLKLKAVRRLPSGVIQLRYAVIK